jgi:hypothetical protein
METTLPHLKSAAAARELGVPYFKLYYLAHNGSVPAPPRDSSGDFCWRPQDIEAARQALAARGRRSPAAAGAAG